MVPLKAFNEAMQELIDSGKAVPEPTPVGYVTQFIACPRCGWELRDLPEDRTDPDNNKKYRRCRCSRCGTQTWRRTP